MQQTEKYKLSLIEKDDVFSPDALNENARKMEAALNTKSDAAAVEERLAALEIHKIVVGSYAGGSTHTIELDATPKLIVLHRKGSTQLSSFICESDTSHGSIIENGFIIKPDSGSSGINSQYDRFMYAAFI